MIFLACSVFVWFLFHGHLWTCRYHKALCTPYFMYLQNHNDLSVDGNHHLIDYSVKQQTLCNALPAVTASHGQRRAFLLIENNTMDEWLQRLNDYHQGIVVQSIELNQDIASCSDIIDTVNVAESETLDDVQIVFSSFVIPASKTHKKCGLFYRCLADIAHCSDVTVIDLVEYNEWGSGTIDRQYFQWLQFHPFGLKYLHIVPQDPSLEHFYFDMLLQLV